MNFVSPYIKSVCFALALCLCAAANAQNEEIEEDRPTYKNALGIRPQYALFGFYGLSYERYIAKNFSIIAYGEFSDGPKILSSAINNWVENSMNVEDARIYYTGYGGFIGTRRYFVDKKISLVGSKDLGSLTGWFVGAYIPVRMLKVNLDIKSTELHYYARQTDNGRLRFDDWLYGLGVEGGRHWVWGNFNFELNVGLTYMNSIGDPGKFTFNRPGIGPYEASKDTGLPGLYSRFSPKFEIVMGIGF